MEEFVCKIDDCAFVGKNITSLFSHAGSKHKESKVDEMRKEVCREIIHDIMSNVKGERISKSEFEKHSPVSKHFLKSSFGSYKNAFEKCGYLVGELKNYNLKEDMNRVSKEHCNDEPPTEKDLEKHSEFSKNTFVNRFGSHNQALKESGFEPNKEMYIDNQVLIDDILNVKQELGRVPSQQEMGEMGEHGVTTLQRNFGCWTNAVREAGLEPIEKVSGERHRYYSSPEEMPCEPFKSGEEHHGWRGGHEDYYGPNWYSIREKALERADYECEHPDCSKSVCDTGEGLHCHHIVPNELTESQTEHDLDNLLILCREHHIGDNGVEPIDKAKRPLD